MRISFPAFVCLCFLGLGCTAKVSVSGDQVRRVDAEALEVLPSVSPLTRVRDMVALPGRVWVLDGSPPFLTRIDFCSGESASFGGEGEGPGEFLNPWAIQPLPEEYGPELRVWDMGNRRISTLDSAGTLVRSAPWSGDGVIQARSDIRDVSYADPFRIRGKGDQVFTVLFRRRVDRTADVADGVLWRADPTVAPIASLLRLRDHVDPGADLRKEWAAVPLWDFCDDRVVLWSPLLESVIWLDPSGEVEASVPFPGSPIPIGPEEIAVYLRWMARLELGPDGASRGIDFPRVAEAYRDRFATQHPGPVDVRCESRRAAWVRIFDPSADPTGLGRSWVRLSRDQPPQEFNFSSGFTPFLFRGGEAFGVLEVPGGYQQVARWDFGDLMGEMGNSSFRGREVP